MRHRRAARAPWVGLADRARPGGAGVRACRRSSDWEVLVPRRRAARRTDEVPPLHGCWDPKLFGPGHAARGRARAARAGGTAADLAERLPWRRLLLASYVAALAWLLALALRRRDRRDLAGARQPVRVPAQPRATVDRRARAARRATSAGSRYDAADNWPTHVGRPPAGRAAVLRRCWCRLGLGGDFAAGLVVTVLAATTAVAVLVTLRALGAERWRGGRRRSWCSTPAAVFMAVSADAMFARGRRLGRWPAWRWRDRASRGRLVAWSALAGLLLGCRVMMSYGLPLIGAARGRRAGRRPGRGGRCRSPRRSRWRWCSASRRAASPGGRPTRCSTTATATASRPTGRRPTGCGATSPRCVSAPGRCSAPASGAAGSRPRLGDARRGSVLLLVGAAVAMVARRPVADEQGRGRADLAAVRAVAAAVAARCCPSGGGAGGWRCRCVCALVVQHLLYTLVRGDRAGVRSRSSSRRRCAARRRSGAQRRGRERRQPLARADLRR